MNIIGNKQDGKQYITQNNYLRNIFQKKVIKLSINAGFSCPNRDGRKGTGGCTYCSAELSGDFSGCVTKSITQQLDDQIILLSKKWSNCLYIPYFQAGSNTYAETAILKEKFEEALKFKNTVGLSVATRADCISSDTADYLSELSKRTYLTVELGLQSIFDSTADKINRCHTYDEFLKTYKMLTDRNINVCIHLINGFPWETREMMLETARETAKLKPHAVKIHMLHILKGTPLGSEYEKSPFTLLSANEYISIVCDQIELMYPETIIERVTGDGNKETLLAPLWTADKKKVMNGIDKEMRRRGAVQGDKYQK